MQKSKQSAITAFFFPSVNESVGSFVAFCLPTVPAFTLVEMVISMGLVGIILIPLLLTSSATISSQVLKSRNATQVERNLAVMMDKMVERVAKTQQLAVPAGRWNAAKEFRFDYFESSSGKRQLGGYRIVTQDSRTFLEELTAPNGAIVFNNPYSTLNRQDWLLLPETASFEYCRASATCGTSDADVATAKWIRLKDFNFTASAQESFGGGEAVKKSYNLPFHSVYIDSNRAWSRLVGPSTGGDTPLLSVTTENNAFGGTGDVVDLSKVTTNGNANALWGAPHAFNQATASVTRSILAGVTVQEIGFNEQYRTFVIKTDIGFYTWNPSMKQARFAGLSPPYAYLIQPYLDTTPDTDARGSGNNDGDDSNYYPSNLSYVFNNRTYTSRVEDLADGDSIPDTNATLHRDSTPVFNADYNAATRPNVGNGADCSLKVSPSDWSMSSMKLQNRVVSSFTTPTTSTSTTSEPANIFTFGYTHHGDRPFIRQEYNNGVWTYHYYYHLYSSDPGDWLFFFDVYDCSNRPGKTLQGSNCVGTTTTTTYTTTHTVTVTPADYSLMLKNLNAGAGGSYTSWPVQEPSLIWSDVDENRFVYTKKQSGQVSLYSYTVATNTELYLGHLPTNARAEALNNTPSAKRHFYWLKNPDNNPGTADADMLMFVDNSNHVRVHFSGNANLPPNNLDMNTDSDPATGNGTIPTVNGAGFGDIADSGRGGVLSSSFTGSSYNHSTTSNRPIQNHGPHQAVGNPAYFSNYAASWLWNVVWARDMTQLVGYAVSPSTGQHTLLFKSDSNGLLDSYIASAKDYSINAHKATELTGVGMNFNQLVGFACKDTMQACYTLNGADARIYRYDQTTNPSQTPSFNWSTLSGLVPSPFGLVHDSVSDQVFTSSSQLVSRNGFQYFVVQGYNSAGQLGTRIEVRLTALPTEPFSTANALSELRNAIPQRNYSFHLNTVSKRLTIADEENEKLYVFNVTSALE